MDINNIRKIGARLKKEISSRMDVLNDHSALGKGASGDMTHPVDKLAEDIVYEELERLGEPVTLVSEECGTREIRGGGPRLLVDPIDGSRNAVSGIPLFSTSIALVNGDTVGQTGIGYVINLVSGDEFWAIKDSGSFFNGSPVRTQQDAVFRVIVYEARTPKTDVPRIIPLISEFHRVRCFGSTALDMAFLAQGAVSVFVVPSPSRSFDFASGYILIKEAGGLVTDLAGREIGGVEVGVNRSTPLLASANAELHKRMVEIIKRRGPGE
ncbi:MAG: inositol monophosphatase family protein [Nitrospirota bacterium]